MNCNPHIFGTLFLLGLICHFPFVSHSQTNSQPINIDSLEQPIIFYGFDFSHLQVVEPKKSGKNLNHFLNELNAYLNKATYTKTFSQLTRAGSLKLVYQATSVLPENYTESKVVVDSRTAFPEDSLQHFVDAYINTESIGTGCIIVFDCFDRNTSTTSAYLLLIENKTRKIIVVKHLEHIENKNYANMNAWHETSVAIIMKLFQSAYQ